MNLTDYYQSYKKYFWAWEEDTNVLTIPGGSTIAFKEQVAKILTGIAENGLPSFGAFLLAMIATNKTVDDPVENVASIIRVRQQDATEMYNAGVIDEAFFFLKLLQTIPAEYATGKRRQILLQTIFAGSHRKLNVSTSKGIAAGLKDIAHGKKKITLQKDFDSLVFLKDFRTIALLLRKFPTAQSIIDAMGDLPKLSEEEVPILEHHGAPKIVYANFVEELMDNTQTFHAAALIKPIWAGFKVPIFNAYPSEQPLGGVSDLSNKGDFDKLVISEFANDDLIFMNRIANNEALYIRREMPPVRDQLHRNILIDISLKTWGTPKILAYATYIAIARHPKSLSEARAFALGNHYAPISCGNAGEVIDGLQKVDAALHASGGLAAFLEAHKQDKQLELFFITTAEAIKYPGVQKLLVDHHALFKYIITTDEEGEINFYRRTNKIQKHLQTIRLPLGKLWTKKPAKEIKGQQPVFADVPPGFAPLLMPTPTQIKKTIPFEEDVYVVANKCLYKRSIEENKKANKGWQLLLRNVPTSGNYELGKAENGEIQFLSFNLQNKELSITNLDTLQNAKIHFPHWSGKHYPQFLFNKYHRFIYLVKNPDSFTLEPDFITGRISFEKQHLTSNIFGLDYPERQKEINNFPAVLSRDNVLRNVNEVYVNQNDCLVFNQHRLMYTDSSVGFSVNNEQTKLAQATKNAKTDDFTFKDGSKIVIDRSGFMELISSNRDITPIFIIPRMSMSLGMATSTEFAGSNVFYNGHLGEVNVTIESPGRQPLGAVKVIKSNFIGMGLFEAKQIIDSIPKMIPTKIDYNNAVKMVEDLKSMDCIARMSSPKHLPQKFVSEATFYQQNIFTFIKHIIDHAPQG